MEDGNKPDENQTEQKKKKPRSEAQMAVLEKARQKAYEMRKQRAQDGKLKKEETKVQRKMTEAEEEAEVLKLKQLAHEKQLNVEIVKPKKPRPPPRKKEVAPPEVPPPEVPAPEVPPKKIFDYDDRGNLLYFY
jgi:hypothetical protein